MLPDRRVHATLPTQDVDALRPFYEGILGFEPLAVRPGAVVYRAGQGTIFAITRSGGKATGAHTQMSFTVPDVAAEVAELRGRGVVFEEYQTPKTEDGVAQMPAGRAAWLKDPDGNLIGIFEFADPV
jgi:catechol 2,3-dioxygenase-like lactoylglutathione lyase family enzyme